MKYLLISVHATLVLFSIEVSGQVVMNKENKIITLHDYTHSMAYEVLRTDSKLETYKYDDKTGVMTFVTTSFSNFCWMNIYQLKLDFNTGKWNYLCCYTTSIERNFKTNDVPTSITLSDMNTITFKYSDSRGEMNFIINNEKGVCYNPISKKTSKLLKSGFVLQGERF